MRAHERNGSNTERGRKNEFGKSMCGTQDILERFFRFFSLFPLPSPAQSLVRIIRARTHTRAPNPLSAAREKEKFTCPPLEKDRKMERNIVATISFRWEKLAPLAPFAAPTICARNSYWRLGLGVRRCRRDRCCCSPKIVTRPSISLPRRS